MNSLNFKYIEMYLTPLLFSLFVFGLNVTHAGVFLQGYNDGVGGKT